MMKIAARILLLVAFSSHATASKYRRLQNGVEEDLPPPREEGGTRPPRPERPFDPTQLHCNTTTNLIVNTTNTTVPSAARLRGNVGCVDMVAHDLRTIPVVEDRDAYNIYGPMEGGLGEGAVPAGIDTNTAEDMAQYLFPEMNITVLDACGGHALPYHYHERMECLYYSDPETGHSTRVGTAGDGNGIYGHFIDGGVLPTDLDACGGRFGVTPDSDGQVVYYYPIKSYAPFTLSCFGPVSSVQECRDLYDTCGDDADILNITTAFGTGMYTQDCPCFDEYHSNVIGQGRPAYLPPAEGADDVGDETLPPVDDPVLTPDETIEPAETGNESLPVLGDDTDIVFAESMSKASDYSSHFVTIALLLVAAVWN